MYTEAMLGYVALHVVTPGPGVLLIGGGGAAEAWHRVEAGPVDGGAPDAHSAGAAPHEAPLDGSATAGALQYKWAS